MLAIQNQGTIVQKLYTTAQLAERFNRTAKTITVWISDGKFPNAFKISDLPNAPYLVPEQDVKDFEGQLSKEE